MTPLYAWDGPGQTRELSLSRAEPPKITRPASPTEGSADIDMLWECTVDDCGKRFKKAMIGARHFNSSHSDLKIEKESWRKWVKRVIE